MLASILTSCDRRPGHRVGALFYDFAGEGREIQPHFMFKALRILDTLDSDIDSTTPRSTKRCSQVCRRWEPENIATEIWLLPWWMVEERSILVFVFLLLPRKITFRNDLGLTSGYVREKWIQQDGPQEEYELNNYVEIWKLNFSLQHPNHAKPVAWERKKRTSCFEGTTTDFALIQLFQFNFLWLCKFRMCQESEKKAFQPKSSRVSYPSHAYMHKNNSCGWRDTEKGILRAANWGWLFRSSTQIYGFF